METKTLKYFEYKYLPDRLQSICQKFYHLAHDLEEALPFCAEKSAMLRKLLEAKDCAVRASMEIE